MAMMLEKYTIGIGDRFGCQGKAQLNALVKAKEQGLHVVPAWNKSYREHSITHSQPEDVRMEADEAVRALGWKESYYVDADHVGLKNVDLFLDSSDFFTLDVADSIGRPPDESLLEHFVEKYSTYAGSLVIPGMVASLDIKEEQIRSMASKYLLAVQEAGRIYRHIENKKGTGAFITEISIDETDEPQTPIEILFILAAVAEENIPIQTIAPKFTGRFNKGVDYEGDRDQFEREFREDLAILAFAAKEFSLPHNLKLSVHSGSDKFSLYGPINRALSKFDAGIHIKTAGTTWLEELIGLALGGDGLLICREIYRKAIQKWDELCAPYLSVIDIDASKLPSCEEVNEWTGEQFANALRHNPSCETFNPDLRQLMHVAYKIAAEMGPAFTKALKNSADIVGEQVTENIYERHLKPLFLTQE